MGHYHKTVLPLTMTDEQIIPSFKEVMEDEIIINELKSLYLGIANKTDSDGSIDDWECILADRMSAIINDDLETFEKRWDHLNGRTYMTTITMPNKAADIIFETLAMDIESSSIDNEIREELQTALDSIRTI